MREAYPGIFTTTEKVSAPSSFPCVSIVEQENTTYQRSLDAEHKEHHANLMYEIEVFSNLQTGKKSKCREIAGVADEVMLGLNFTRAMLTPIPNADGDIFRYFARYTAVVGEDGFLYRK